MTSFKKHLLGIYIHWPYCLSKCPYCDFYSHPVKNIEETLLFQGYKRDIQQFLPYLEDRKVTSLFFGGGTPSLMSAPLLEKILNEISTYFSLSTDCEISLEANPDAITKEKMKDFASLGVNRLSIGVQSLNENDLKLLGRRHSVQRALACIQEAQEVFSRINMDLIYARAYQKLQDWEKELQQALALGLSHYSLYQLTIEEGTLFYKKGVQGASPLYANRMYRLTDEIMTSAGIPAYEISNYAQKGQACRHNLLYWHLNNYIGLGPGAHGRVNLWATSGAPSVARWLKEGISFEALTEQEHRLEQVLMGLRLTQEGFPVSALSPKGVRQALDKKWIFIKNNQVYTTLRGRLLLNKLIETVA